jgi:hypothetical protein
MIVMYSLEGRASGEATRFASQRCQRGRRHKKLAFQVCRRAATASTIQRRPDQVSVDTCVQANKRQDCKLHGPHQACNAMACHASKQQRGTAIRRWAGRNFPPIIPRSDKMKYAQSPLGRSNPWYPAISHPAASAIRRRKTVIARRQRSICPQPSAGAVGWRTIITAAGLTRLIMTTCHTDRDHGDPNWAGRVFAVNCRRHGPRVRS